MGLPAMAANQRMLGQSYATRWDELKETVSLMIDLGLCFDQSGIDVYFLNRPPVQRVKSISSKAFVDSFASPPRGSTPLTETLARVVRECGGEKPVLLFILTDGVPNGGPG